MADLFYCRKKYASYYRRGRKLMGYINKLIDDIMADYESDVYSIIQLSEKYGVGTEFILNCITTYDKPKKKKKGS